MGRLADQARPSTSLPGPGWACSPALRECRQAFCLPGTAFGPLLPTACRSACSPHSGRAELGSSPHCFGLHLGKVGIVLPAVGRAPVRTDPLEYREAGKP